MALPSLVTLAQALGPVQQDHLLQARQMQALSFAVHIPLVCFGIAFPVMVLVMEWMGHRTGDPLYLAIARRWSRIMVALFAVGRHHGHDPQLRDGAAVAQLHGHLRRRLRPRLRHRGLLVLPRGDLHRDLHLRLGPPVAARAHAQRAADRLHRLHRLVDGHRRQRVDEPPGGLSPRPRRGGRHPPGRTRCSATPTCGTSSSTCTWRATSSPASSSPGPTRSRACAGAGAATSARRSWCR